MSHVTTKKLKQIQKYLTVFEKKDGFFRKSVIIRIYNNRIVLKSVLYILKKIIYIGVHYFC